MDSNLSNLEFGLLLVALVEFVVVVGLGSGMHGMKQELRERGKHGSTMPLIKLPPGEYERYESQVFALVRPLDDTASGPIAVSYPGEIPKKFAVNPPSYDIRVFDTTDSLQVRQIRPTPSPQNLHLETIDSD